MLREVGGTFGGGLDLCGSYGKLQSHHCQAAGYCQLQAAGTVMMSVQMMAVQNICCHPENTACNLC